MRRSILATAVAACALLAACAGLQPPPGAPAERAAHSGACHAEPVQWAIGADAGTEVTGRIWRESHAGLIRPIAPGQAVTRDHRPDRINVEIDADNVIRRIWCG